MHGDSAEKVDLEYFANIVSNRVSAMLAYWDSELVCRYANDAYLVWFGRRKEEMIGKMTMQELVGPEIFQKNLPYVKEVLRGIPQTFEREIPLPSGNGTRFSLANYYPNVADGEVRGFFVHVADITTLKLLEAELIQSHELVKEQNKRLLNFANIVTHNLKSYANNLGIMLDMFSNAETEADKQQIFQYLKDISSGFSNTIGHLTDVVDTQTRTDLSKERVVLRDYTKKATDTLRIETNESKATVINNVCADIRLEANPAYLESIFLNLVSNAIKYCHPDRKPVVEINAWEHEGELVVEITDNGQGIDLNKYRSSIFGLYKTFHGNSDAKGVGLYLVRSQVESMGGSIDVRSEEGVGSTFVITFRM